MNKDLTIYKVVEEYEFWAEVKDLGTIPIFAKILESNKQTENTGYSYSISHYTTLGGESGFYHKNGISGTLAETRKLLFQYFSFFDKDSKVSINEFYH